MVDLIVLGTYKYFAVFRFSDDIQKVIKMYFGNLVFSALS